MDIKEICPPLVSEHMNDLRRRIAEEELSFKRQYDCLRADEYSTAEAIDRKIQQISTELYYRTQPLKEELQSTLAAIARIYAMRPPSRFVIPLDN